MASVSCGMCGAGFCGRADAVYCSSACRQKAHRARTASRSDALHERLGRASEPAPTRAEDFKTLRRSVAISIRRAQEQVDRSRELCRTSTERLQEATAIRQRCSSYLAVAAAGTAFAKGAPWLSD